MKAHRTHNGQRFSTSALQAGANRRTRRTHDVIVVGAGAAGIGVAVALLHAGVDDLLVIDRHDVGASFQRWPQQMRFITPSFPTNSVGMLDLNSIAIGTSPAYSLQVEHPTGAAYAEYLQGVARHFELPLVIGKEVHSLVREAEGFAIKARADTLYARHVVWAAGEFQYPLLSPFPGAEHCLHNSHVKSWRKVAGREVIVIGGNESGMDAAIHLARLGKKVLVLDRSAPWKSEDSDPSLSLSTFTTERLQSEDVLPRIKFVSNAEVREVRRRRGMLEVVCKSGRTFRTPSPPILATGFRSSVKLIAQMFEEREDGLPLLSEYDESTVTPGLFLAGPMVRHEKHAFCFIYKFRQRFAVVAKAIADRLGLPAEQLELYRQWGMYLDDLSCCGQACVC